MTGHSDIKLLGLIGYRGYFVGFIKHILTESVGDLDVTSDEVKFHDDLPNVGASPNLWAILSRQSLMFNTLVPNIFGCHLFKLVVF